MYLPGTLLSVVFDYLKTLHPPKDIDLQNLTYRSKLVMLCALVTGQRCQTLHLMNLDYMHRDSSVSYIFHIHLTSLLSNLLLAKTNLF